MVYITDTHPRRTVIQRRVRFVMGTVIVACLIWAFTAIPYDILREERFRLFGEEATAGAVMKAYSDSSPEFPEAGLMVEYKYADQDGMAHAAVARVPSSTWTRYRVGRTIKVLYVPSRPDISRLPDEVEPAFQVWLRNLMN